MKSIFKIEFIKTWNYPAFRVILILHALLYLMVITIGSQFSIDIQGVRVDKLFAFPHIWETFAWIGSWFNLLLGILVATLVSNEFHFKTLRKQVIDGMNKSEWLTGKLFLVISLSLYAFLLVFVSGLVIGLINTENSFDAGIFDNFSVVAILFIQAFAYMMLGVLFAILFKSNALSIVFFILFFALIEPIFRAFFPSSIDKFFPVKIISNLTPVPDFFSIAAGDLVQIKSGNPTDLYSMGILPEHLSLGPATVVCIIYIGIFYLVSRIVLNKIDL